MARMVKCCVTGTTGNSTDFFKSGNKWFQSEEVYLSWKSEKETHEKIFIKIGEILGHETLPGCLGGITGKKLKECKLNREEFYKVLLEKEEYLRELFSRSNESDASRIFAIFTVVSTIPQSITYGGCYEIKNIDTEEVYIGETIDMFSRFNTHVSQLYSSTHHCEKLQSAFNENHDISHFKFSPLFLYEIKNKDKESEKLRTLYLETAFYLKAKEKKKILYNTVDPYEALKTNSVSLDNYNIDCKTVLKMLIEDEFNILPLKIKKIIEKELSN